MMYRVIEIVLFLLIFLDRVDNRNISDLVRECGFEFDTHYLNTPDNYTLKLYRLQLGNKAKTINSASEFRYGYLETASKLKQSYKTNLINKIKQSDKTHQNSNHVILFLHGLFGSAESWFSDYCENTIPARLTDGTYDMWYADRRGVGSNQATNMHFKYHNLEMNKWPDSTTDNNTRFTASSESNNENSSLNINETSEIHLNNNSLKKTTNTTTTDGESIHPNNCKSALFTTVDYTNCDDHAINKFIDDGDGNYFGINDVSILRATNSTDNDSADRNPIYNFNISTEPTIDIPEIIHYIHSLTKKKITVVAHSISATFFLSALMTANQNRPIDNKINRAILIGPILSFNHLTGHLKDLFSQMDQHQNGTFEISNYAMTDTIYNKKDKKNYTNFFEVNDSFDLASYGPVFKFDTYRCDSYEFLSLCLYEFQQLFGDSSNIYTLEQVTRITEAFGQPVSMKLLHQLQIIWKNNQYLLPIYKNTTDNSSNSTNSQIIIDLDKFVSSNFSITIFMGDRDRLSTIADIDHLKILLPFWDIVIIKEDMNHLDFLVGQGLANLMPDLLKIIKNT